MDMDQAAVFLAGSILTVLGFLVALCGILIANNLVAKYWKSWGWKMTPDYWNHSPQFMTEEQAAKVAPHLEEDYGNKKETTQKV